MTARPHAVFEAARSGLYRTPGEMDLLRQAAARLGVAYCGVNLKRVVDKGGFLAACAAALQFPDGFGHNWDAFADSMQDLSWRAARGHVIHLQHAGGFARASPDDYATSVEILRQSAEYSKKRGAIFIVLIDEASDLPAFPS
jgi:barstar (barnase inhibitor)